MPFTSTDKSPRRRITKKSVSAMGGKGFMTHRVTKLILFGLVVVLPPVCQAVQYSLPSIRETAPFRSRSARRGNAEDSPFGYAYRYPHYSNNGIYVPGGRTTDEAKWRQVIENHGTSSLSAFYEYVDCKGYPEPQFGDYDSVLGPVYVPGMVAAIPPSGSIEVKSDDPSRCQVRASAAIFSDGHSEGDPHFVQFLYHVRIGAYKELAELIPLLDDLATLRRTRREVFDLVSKRKYDFDMTHVVGSPNEGNAGGEIHGRDVAFEAVISVMTPLGGWNNHPSPSLPSWASPFLDFLEGDLADPLPASTEDIMRRNKVSREQAEAMFIDARFKKWRDALGTNLGPLRGK